MLRFKAMGSFLLISGLLAGAFASNAVAASDPGAASASAFEKAKQLASETGRPILLKVGAGACGSCEKFDEDCVSDPALKAALEKNVVFLRAVAGEGEAADIVRMYSIRDFPAFILADSRGELMDRWNGYSTPEKFVGDLTAAVENPITVEERLARFQQSPSEIDARKLGELREYEGYFAEAVAFYSRARVLNRDSETNYDLLTLNAMTRGTQTRLYDYDQIRAQADRVLASGDRTPAVTLKVAYTMNKMAALAGDPSYFIPYLKTAVESTAGDPDAEIQKMRAKLMPDYALHIEKDVKKAVELKKQSFAEWDAKWLEKASGLNNFAWWCFENKINLDEAEKFARKGIELAEAGNMKANILDTLAEICNVKGDCGQAVEYIRLAVAEDPENKYVQKQLVRFQELLAAQTNK
jgi:thioredoxin-related protein